MNVNYALDPLGKISMSWPLAGDPDVDETPARIGGVSFQSSVACIFTSELLGAIRLVIRCSPKGISLTSLAVVRPPKGRVITPALLKRVAHELPGLVREAVVGSRNAVRWEEEDVDPVRVWEVVHAAMMPRRNSGESASEFVYRMWTTQYQPYGLTQKDLAKDLGRSYDLVREYVSKEARLNVGTTITEMSPQN